MDESLSSLSLAEVSELLRGRKVSPVELTELCLARVQESNATLNAFIRVMPEPALKEARAAEAEIQRGQWRGPLHGVPIALKDLIDTAGVRTTAASAMFQNRVPKQDAEAVRRLRQAGAVIFGKLNLHEFAYGGSGTISHFGAVRNPCDPAHITGGSSSGSAAAVGAELCYAALGTDTAGSIRLPAACCGVVGLKPSYGLVSARGVIPLAPSYDHVGPMTRSVADAALVLAAIAGYDPDDPTSRQFPPADYVAALAGKTSALRLGVPRPFFFEELDPEIEALTSDTLSLLATLTAGLREVTVEVDTDRSLSMAEAYAYHAQFVAACPQLYHPETLRRIQAGAKVSAATREQKRRELEALRRSIAAVFAGVDLVVTPTVPMPPPSFAELEAHPEQLREKELRMLRNTRPWNVFGLPTISIPCGFTRAGLPAGLQITGPAGGEAAVLALAHAYERATEWRKRGPRKG